MRRRAGINIKSESERQKQTTMKKTFTILAATLLVANIFLHEQSIAQAPEKMSYQAVIRDANDHLVANQAVGMQVSILKGSASGTAVYVETQGPTSSANGLVSMEIGGGTVVSGDFAAIDWANGPYFIKTETDPTGGTNYSIVGTSELLSVPYALYSLNGTPGPKGDTGLQGPTGLQGLQGPKGETGAQCIQGIQGPTGAAGPKGEQGDQGLQGAIGPTGSKGDTGDQGIQGEIGPAGLKGETGAQCIQGIQGPTGAAGPKGEQGDQGLQGAIGPTGSKGDTGDQGIQGEIGPQGPKGETGAQGIQGIQGPTGAAGPKGEQGDQGLQGAIGPTGSKGDTGDQGIQGEIGPQGPKGETGAQGIQGIQGPTGAAGPKGQQGLQGEIGLQGPAGADGLTTSVNNITQDDGNITLTTANISPSTDYNYVNDAQLSDIDGIDANTAAIAVNQQAIQDTASQIRADIPDVSGFISIEEDPSVPAGTQHGDMQYWNGTAWVTVAATVNQGATLQMIGGVPTWTGGTPPPQVGDSYGGGKVFYIFLPGDPGYIAGETHGLIAATEDQSTGIQWRNGVYMVTGASETTLGTGSANTDEIINDQGSGTYAASKARAHRGGGYDDWYLPSKDELNLLYLQKTEDDGFASASYWSSTENSKKYAYRQYFVNGDQQVYDKSNLIYVRAVRAF
jgi:hypothetical protein